MAQVRIATRLLSERQGNWDAIIRPETFPSTPTSRFTQPHMQWIMASPFMEESGQKVKLTTHLYQVLRLRMFELYFYSNMHSLCGA
jgi:hypothetical protein